SRSINGPAAADDARLTGLHSAGPQPPLADSAHQLQATFGKFQAAIERLEPAFDLFAGNNLVRQRVAKRFQTDILIAHSLRIEAEAKSVNGTCIEQALTLALRGNERLDRLTVIRNRDRPADGAHFLAFGIDA